MKEKTVNEQAQGLKPQPQLQPREFSPCFLENNWPSHCFAVSAPFARIQIFPALLAPCLPWLEFFNP